jgi:RNA polymerase sigma factor (sigma-70 family)
MVATVGEPASGLDFEAFFQAEYPRLVRALYLVTTDQPEAEDLVQEAMTRAYERWTRVRAMDCPVGYVYRAAVNLHRKRLRRLAFLVRRLPTSAQSDPSLAVETRSDIARALSSLPEGQRVALVLVEWLGFSAEAAASVLGIEPASVRSRVHREEAPPGKTGRT